MLSKDLIKSMIEDYVFLKEEQEVFIQEALGKKPDVTAKDAQNKAHLIFWEKLHQIGLNTRYDRLNDLKAKIKALEALL